MNVQAYVCSECIQNLIVNQQMGRDGPHNRLHNPCFRTLLELFLKIDRNTHNIAAKKYLKAFG